MEVVVCGFLNPQEGDHGRDQNGGGTTRVKGTANVELQRNPMASCWGHGVFGAGWRASDRVAIVGGRSGGADKRRACGSRVICSECQESAPCRCTNGRGSRHACASPASPSRAFHSRDSSRVADALCLRRDVSARDRPATAHRMDSWSTNFGLMDCQIDRLTARRRHARFRCLGRVLETRMPATCG